VFRRKFNADGSFSKYKVRLVAQGFSQREGVDFTECYAPTVCITTVRAVLALAAAARAQLFQLDVKAAYVQAYLTERVFMRAPPLLDVPPGKVLLLHKALYGLRQAGFEWNRHLHAVLTGMGLRRVDGDECLYEWLQDGERLVAAVYVDDVIGFSTSPPLRDRFFAELRRSFDIDDRGTPTSILGMHVAHGDDGSVSISQAALVDGLLRRFGMAQAGRFEARTPLKHGEFLPHMPRSDNEFTARYRQVVGAISHLARTTRPDLSHASNYLARFLGRSDDRHYAAAMHVLRYLRHTRAACIRYAPGPLVLRAFCDADHASDWSASADVKSTSGFLFLLAGGPISWSTKKQEDTVARSSTHAELRAVAHACGELVAVRKVLDHLRIEVAQRQICLSPSDLAASAAGGGGGGSSAGIGRGGTHAAMEHCAAEARSGEKTPPAQLLIDSQSAIKALKRGYNTGGARTMALDLATIRSFLESGFVDFDYVPTIDNLADVFTKSLGPQQFEAKARRFMHGLACAHGGGGGDGDEADDGADDAGGSGGGGGGIEAAAARVVVRERGSGLTAAAAAAAASTQTLVDSRHF
jgi:hypothetical protein